ncbi:transglutaminase family protein [Celeribacter arenosi]|uniref:Transglutaminase family protein n=1 Tax=Celeribacter arenosi TaxID=792649 RepID=A0ABP7K6F8_9RHOB
MRLNILHKTTYRFEEPVKSGLQQLRKTPKSSHQQSVIHWSTTIEGGRSELSYDDHHNNVVELISIDRGAKVLTVTSQGEVELTNTHGVLGRHLGPAPLWLFQRETPRTKARSAAKALIRDLEGEGDLAELHALKDRIRDTVAYEVGSSMSDWSAEDALEAGKGVCQDHAHIFIACARAMGFPARYVSGYLMLDDRTVQDAMHAWAEAHVDGLGWVGFDVSNGISPDERYVRVATGLDYSDAAPVSGTRVGGKGEELSVEIEVAQQ